MNAALFSILVLLIAGVILSLSCDNNKLVRQFGLSAFVLLVFLMGLTRGDVVGTDTIRYVDWLKSSILTGVVEAVASTRFESGFTLLVYPLGSLFGPETAITLLSAFTNALFPLIIFALSRHMGFSKTAMIFAAMQVPLWFFFIDMSFNTLRAALATLILNFAFLLVLRERHLLGSVIAASASLFHLTAAPIMLASALVYVYPKPLFWVSFWVSALIFQLFLNTANVSNLIKSYFPLELHQISILETWEGETSNSLIALSAILALIAIWISVREDNNINRQKLALTFLASNAIYILVAGLPFSYRLAYFSFSISPILIAYTINVVPVPGRYIFGMSLLALISASNYSFFEFVRIFYFF